MVDLAIETNNGWILVDYKSDHKPPITGSSRYDKYNKQMQLYALGWEMLTGSLPKEVYLFYLAVGELAVVEVERRHSIEITEQIRICNNEKFD